MYNLSIDEISMVDGGGDGAYYNSGNAGRHTNYGGQGGGFVGNPNKSNCTGGVLTSAFGSAATGAMNGGGLGGAIIGGALGALGGIGGCM